MEKLHDTLTEAFDELPVHDDATLKMRRAIAVQGIVREAIEKVYKDLAPYMFEHINAVYILTNEEGQKELIIYTDDSMVRADLDARQEFLKIALFAQGEEISSFRLIASRGNIRKHHPFVEKEDISHFNPQYLVYFAQEQHPLSTEQEQASAEASSHIEDPRVAQSFLKAMRANLKTH